MLKLKEICAKAVNKLAHDMVDAKIVEYKENLLIKIRETAEQGSFYYVVNRFGCPDGHWLEIKEWLESLGFAVVWKVPDFTATIQWDDVSIAEIEMITKPKPATIKFVEPIYAWGYIPQTHDFMCHHCNKTSEYTTNYCPNCGVRMCVPEGGKERKYGS